MSRQIVNLVSAAGMIARGSIIAGVVLCALVVGLRGCSKDDGSSSGNANAQATSPGASPRIGDAEIAKSLNAAEQYFNSGDYANARMILMRLISDAPARLAARELLGQVYAAEASIATGAGRHDDAAANQRKSWEQYREAVKLAPQQAGLHHSAALIALMAGERDAAIQLLAEATRLEPGNPQYPMYLAQLYIQDDRLDDAEELIQSAITLAPDEPHLHATLAAIDLEREQYEDALAHAREAQIINPLDPAFRVQEAKILRRSGEPREALGILTSMSEGDRVKEFVAWEIAANYEEIGEPLSAAQAWVACYWANPLHRNAWQWAVTIGEALANEGRVEEATMWLQEAQRVNAGAAEVVALEKAIDAAGG